MVVVEVAAGVRNELRKGVQWLLHGGPGEHTRRKRGPAAARAILQLLNFFLVLVLPLWLEDLLHFVEAFGVVEVPRDQLVLQRFHDALELQEVHGHVDVKVLEERFLLAEELQHTHQRLPVVARQNALNVVRRRAGCVNFCNDMVQRALNLLVVQLVVDEARQEGVQLRLKGVYVTELPALCLLQRFLQLLLELLVLAVRVRVAQQR